MHVVMITDFPDDLDHPGGGLEAVVACLTRGLVAQGIELTIVCWGRPFQGVSLEPELRVPVIGLPRRGPAALTSWWLTPREANRLLRHTKPDVIHVQGLPQLFHNPQVPSVLTIHGFPGKTIRIEKRGLSARIEARLSGTTFRRAIPRYDELIAISPYVLEETEIPNTERTHTIPNPIEYRFFNLRRAPEADRVLYAGKLSRLKNIVGLVEAASRVVATRPNTRFRLAGSWQADHREQILAALERHQLAGHFDFLGSLERNELLEEMVRCTCLVLPSFQETSPVVVAEAMAAGIPVAASRVGGLPWMLETGQNGLLFDPSSREATADAILQLLVDEELRNRLTRRALGWAHEHVHVDSVVRRTIGVYEAACRRRAPGPV
ncbi:MAG: glycosyltransferase family 4 protein [Myxococcota bacterium]